MIIKLDNRYSQWLKLFENRFKTFPTYKERTDCFLAIINNTVPWWIKS